ncbi:MAG: hypothetical protein Q4G16_12275, partial [Cruoricaptor ignavus]|nr:hypothetical protein [Cruoricaptor ignavus]
TLGLLFILMLFASYSCDRDSDDRTDILENTSWNLIGYKDNRGNYSTVVYPNDCSDNSCYMLMFKDGSIFGTYDNIPQNKDFGLGNYIAYTDKRFEYIDLPAIETISFGENNDKYIQSMIFVNKYDIKDNILTLFTKESIETEGVILIFQKKEL